MTVRIVHINALLSLKVELWPSRFDYYAKYNVEMYTLWKIHITDTDDVSLKVLTHGQMFVP